MISNLEVVILANLLERESTGYELTKIIKKSPWKTSHQQIYRTLLMLKNKGYLSCKNVYQTKKPNKKIYSITQEGEIIVSNPKLQEAKIKSTQDEANSRLVIGNPQYFINMHSEISKKVDELTDIRIVSDPLTQLAIDRKINLLRADSEWCNHVVKILSNKIKAAA
ncbi:PadR family transcriptional regulator [Photobacterium lutimaris]|uniref:Transcription regulator PadR N-terminal domain-containing protein n=1 Tax=Photobacterium lutimaris TaxID=388278 RepID=A0A2T3IYX3_9GAMM|nr:PadR family transcriptional regulator [Photobacterium lutimaris]PSU33862.1 hypothetical protein C9I99_10850 [Photobacterium lutimaris]TDR76187.1 PadR family transcriptional regulator AphA [Photobacterium lutimaris]